MAGKLKDECEFGIKPDFRHYSLCEVGEVLAVLPAGLLDPLLGADAALLREQHDRRAVRVVGADVGAVLAAQALVARPDAGLQGLDRWAQVIGPLA